MAYPVLSLHFSVRLWCPYLDLRALPKHPIWCGTFPMYLVCPNFMPSFQGWQENPQHPCIYAWVLAFTLSKQAVKPDAYAVHHYNITLSNNFFLLHIYLHNNIRISQLLILCKVGFTSWMCLLHTSLSCFYLGIDLSCDVLHFCTDFSLSVFY